LGREWILIVGSGCAISERHSRHGRHSRKSGHRRNSTDSRHSRHGSERWHGIDLRQGRQSSCSSILKSGQLSDSSGTILLRQDSPRLSQQSLTGGLFNVTGADGLIVDGLLHQMSLQDGLLEEVRLNDGLSIEARLDESLINESVVDDRLADDGLDDGLNKDLSPQDGLLEVLSLNDGLLHDMTTHDRLRIVLMMDDGRSVQWVKCQARLILDDRSWMLVHDRQRQ
jgi:hypothetical protein